MLIVLHPHRHSGRSLDMFVAELPDGTHLKPIRSVMYATARALQARGVPDTELVEYQHVGSSIIAARGVVGELAKWTVIESDERGLQKMLYKPFPSEAVTGKERGGHETAAALHSGASVPFSPAPPQGGSVP